MVPTLICERWTLNLPIHRAERWQWPWWEKQRLLSMHANLTPGDVVYDIGAEEGDLPALWASWGCKVVLFEPNERVWPNIKAVWEGNDLEPPLACFVGFAADTIRGALLESPWPRCAGGPLIGDHGFLNLSERPDVPSTCVDHVAATIAPPDALTIDVEGAEWHVLNGAHQTLADRRPLVWCSLHPEFSVDMYDRTYDDVHALMAEHGYQREYLGFDHELHALYWHPDVHRPVLPYA